MTRACTGNQTVSREGVGEGSNGALGASGAGAGAKVGAAAGTKSSNPNSCQGRCEQTSALGKYSIKGIYRGFNWGEGCS